MIKECIGLYWLCKCMKKVRSSQTANLMVNWEKQFFPVSMVKLEFYSSSDILKMLLDTCTILGWWLK